MQKWLQNMYPCQKKDRTDQTCVQYGVCNVQMFPRERNFWREKPSRTIIESFIIMTLARGTGFGQMKKTNKQKKEMLNK